MHMFRNDYSEGAAPQILEAITRTNEEQCVGYTEGDPHCERARELIRAACGRDDVDVEFCIGGTSANIVGVTGMLRDWEGVICTKDAHINVHETGSIAACGRTILPTQDADGFLSPDEAERVWANQTMTGRHMTRPAMIYITNATEFGGVWDRARFDAICDWARSHDLFVYVDGARMATALTSRGCDLTLIDTAGRLHTSADLMRELAKVVNVTRKRCSVPVAVVLVVDATTGQNGLNQAREFNDALDLDGLIVTKLDGTAKGGIALAISSQLSLPIYRIGVGESIDDLQSFDALEFCRALVGEGM